MTSRRFLSGLTVGAILLTFSACSDEQSSADTTASSTTSTSTTVAESTTSSSSTTSSTTSTSTTSTSTTSTLPAVEGLGLSALGLGDALFGADADSVIEYVASILGDPTNDSAWVDPLVIGAACPGTQVRFVDWNDLALFFTDESPAASGLRHFAAYTYGPGAGDVINPFGLATAAGVGVGATVEFLRAAYPAALVNPADDISGPSFFIEEGLSGFLTGSSNSDTIISFVGGYGCGE